jgi:hypothetical protein
MKALNFFLYIVCFTAISWSGLIFGGPTLVAWATSSYSDGRIKLKNTKISPSLQINVGRVEFNFGDLITDSDLFGISRSVKVDWSIFSDEALVKIRLGPTVIKGFGRSDSVEIKIPSYKNMNLNEFRVAISANGVVLDELGEIASINLSGNLENNFGLLKNTRVSALDLKTVGAFNSFFTSINGRVSDIKIGVPLVDQEIVADFISKEATIDWNDAKIGQIQSTLKLASDQVEFDLDFQNVSSVSLSGMLSDVNVKGKYRSGNFIDPLLVSVSNGAFVDDNVKLVKLDAEVLGLQENAFSAQLQGEFADLEIDIGDNYIGNLSGNKFKIDLDYDASLDQVMTTVGVEFEDPDLVEIKGVASIKTRLAQFMDILNCRNASCGFEGIDLIYEVEFGDQKFTGKSYCTSQKCDFKSMSHYFKTSNTAEIFDSLLGAKILNPVITLYLYSAINAGKKIGKGHELIIN